MKANGNGRKCPDWCATDHEAEDAITESCRTDQPWIRNRAGSAAYRASAYQSAYDEKPRVVTWGDPGMVIQDSPREARDLAAFVGSLADTTPARIRQLAAQIEAASDAAFGAEQEPEAGA